MHSLLLAPALGPKPACDEATAGLPAGFLEVPWLYHTYIGNPNARCLRRAQAHRARGRAYRQCPTARHRDKHTRHPTQTRGRAGASGRRLGLMTELDTRV